MRNIPKHPRQPLIKDDQGRVCFNPNKIVMAFYNAAREGCKLDLNDVSTRDFSDDDRTQFAQLIGYSVGGFSELDYVHDSTYKSVCEEANRLFGTNF